MDAKLTGISETLLIPLWARATETGNNSPIVQDAKAVEMISRIDYDFSKFSGARLSQVGVSIRTMLLDRCVETFLRRNHDAVVVNLGAGLDTRHQRLCPRNTLWYDLDLPEAINLRRRFFSESDNYRFLEQSIFDFTWMDTVNSPENRGRPLLVLAEGLLMYFDENEVRELFHAMARSLPGAELLVELLAPFLKGKSKRHESVKKTAEVPEFKWAIRRARELQTWHPNIYLIDEWNYFDFYKDRWGWIGKISRLPVIRNAMAQRIAHLGIEESPTWRAVN